MTTELVEVEAELVDETDLAFLIWDGREGPKGSPIEVWIPKAHATHDIDAGTFSVPEWLALEKGLI